MIYLIIDYYFVHTLKNLLISGNGYIYKKKCTFHCSTFIIIISNYNYYPELFIFLENIARKKVSFNTMTRYNMEAYFKAVIFARDNNKFKDLFIHLIYRSK